MKKLLAATLSLLLAVCLTACHQQPALLPTTIPKTNAPPSSIPKATAPSTTILETTVPESAPPATTVPEHSSLYIPGVSVEDVILYFNEVCLDREIGHSGDPSVIQKWTEPIHYGITGDCTEEDLATLSAFTAWLNTVDGFPGIHETDDPGQINLRIYFCDQQNMLAIMGESFTDMDGAVTFWYLDNEIYDATICYRTDLKQQLRNSVILEEIYNGLGPIQDTVLREDSVIWQEFSSPQTLTAIDELLLRLLYHPSMRCGMNAQQCEAVIRQLYY